MKTFSPAEELLIELGVEKPSDIDLEAIAWDQGAAIEYRPLEGCEAQIIGKDDMATIVVNANSSRLRQRFSIGHELGHWHYHRGMSINCRTVGESAPTPKNSQHERLADSYAADLLLPQYLLRSNLTDLRRLDFATVLSNATEFDTSVTATALRLVELGPVPALLICHGVNGRKWFVRGPSLPDEWYPNEDLDPSSSCFPAVFGKEQRTRPRTVIASAWLSGWWAERYRVTEEAFKISESDTIVLVGITDPNMIISAED